MSSAGKFTFDHDFGRTAKAPLAPSALERARADGEERARAAGIAEGRAQAKAEFDQRLPMALDALAARAAEILGAADRIEAEASRQALAFAMRFAQAAAGVALERFPLASLEHAARDLFAQLRQAPHCVVRLHESLVEQADEALKRIARERGFEGRLIVMGEPDRTCGDFTLEWADGGVSRDGAALQRQLVEAIARHASADESGATR